MSVAYKSRDGRVYTLMEATANKSLAGKYRIIYMDFHGSRIAWRKPGIENPWLPKAEAEENIKKIASLMGWEEAEKEKPER